MSTTHLDTLLARLSESIQQNQFIKLSLSDRRDKKNDLKNVYVKPVMLKAGLKLSFVYRHPTKDVTKNYEVEESLQLLRDMLEKGFYKADLLTSAGDLHLTLFATGKSALASTPAATARQPDTGHDKNKKRYVVAENNVYLRQLGLTTADGKVKSDKQDKYRQINKYVEIVEDIVESAALPKQFTVVDMGAGKGYLTFALYDYLANTLQLEPRVTGIELRPQLVSDANALAQQANFKGLHFKTGSIDTAELPATDMLIALHACDIATDQAIYRGITSGAKVIICAPCCHKQIRKQMSPANEFKAIAKFGILEERQAEILTDTIRALILEAYGYKTKVFEFISTEHTPKNLLIVGVKQNTVPDKAKIMQQVQKLKADFGIDYHELEKLLQIG